MGKEGQRLEKSESARGRPRQREQRFHKDVQRERKENTQVSRLRRE